MSMAILVKPATIQQREFSADIRKPPNSKILW